MTDAREQQLRVVVGRAPDLDHARHVFQELQNHGIDAADLRLAGTAARRAERHTRDDAAREELDRRVAGHVGRRVGGGAVIGALAGAVVGAIGGLLVTGGDVGDNAALFLVVVVVFAALGGWVLAIVSATSSMGYDDTWQLTFDDSDGTALVAVRVRDPASAADARKLLTQEGVTVVEERTARARDQHTVRW